MNIQVKPVRTVELRKADFVSKQTPRWCPGCGDYSILANVQKVMPELNIPRENIVFVSGIGCSSRFPYYMNTYGLHTIHGRAPAFATGLKVACPDLSVWIVTGDGDGLSIGGNQLLHMLRRNLDVNVLLFNNRIYGLTKGQYSPTSEQGKVTKSTPFGSPDIPLNPMLFALSAGATFIARTYDTDSKGMQNIFKEAAKHKGTSFVEIYQNCNIFNDGTFSAVYERSEREDRILRLNHGKILVFGKDQNKGIRLRGLKPVIVDLDKDFNEKELLIHDQFCEDSTLANLLSGFDYPDFPVPMGIIRQVESPTYGEKIEEQVKSQIEKKGVGNLEKLLRGNHAWTN
ncbi:MAG: 2-oxoacid:ferredoxin oxidoreductase subunit beta [SAR324 cluster bacterium]|jgi:2-oxoglutarate ferredoxin oxidoreductase subunit beta|nr:2-oxoacid:ferredoxin oxidoreductase subunit beta [SAR324 cluster bacterium]